MTLIKSICGLLNSEISPNFELLNRKNFKSTWKVSPKSRPVQVGRKAQGTLKKPLRNHPETDSLSSLRKKLSKRRGAKKRKKWKQFKRRRNSKNKFLLTLSKA